MDGSKIAQNAQALAAAVAGLDDDAIESISDRDWITIHQAGVDLGFMALTELVDRGLRIGFVLEPAPIPDKGAADLTE